MTQGRKQRNKRPGLPFSKVVALAASSVMFLLPVVAHATQNGTFTEEFHKIYPLSAQGRVEIDNLNGPVHITAWDRDEVKVDAVKSAWTKKRLDEAQIEIRSEANDLSIRTQYPDHDHTFNFNDNEEHDNAASVEYTITVPRQARLDEIKLINGGLDVEDVAGEVHASCINGRIHARNLRGRVVLNTINGELEASVDQLPASEIKLSSINGRLRLTLPSDARAELKASTVSGNISDEFGLRVIRHQFVGRSLHGQLGGGGTLVKLSNINGQIEIRHAGDNRPMSTTHDMDRERSRENHDGDSDDKNDDDDDI